MAHFKSMDKVYANDLSWVQRKSSVGITYLKVRIKKLIGFLIKKIFKIIYSTQLNNISSNSLDIVIWICQSLKLKIVR